jgi:hypothetical protein
MGGQVSDIFEPACREVVDHGNFVALSQEFFCQMAADETGPAGDECVRHETVSLLEWSANVC